MASKGLPHPHSSPGAARNVAVPPWRCTLSTVKSPAQSLPSWGHARMSRTCHARRRTAAHEHDRRAVHSTHNAHPCIPYLMQHLLAPPLESHATLFPPKPASRSSPAVPADHDQAGMTWKVTSRGWPPSPFMLPRSQGHADRATTTSFSARNTVKSPAFCSAGGSTQA